MNTPLALPRPAPGGPLRALSTLLYTRRGLLLLALLAPPLLWFGVVYLGSLLSLLANSFFKLDDFTGQVTRELTLANFVALLEPANLDAALRTIVMAVSVTAACTLLAFPLAYYMARHARGAQKAALYIAVMLPLWSSYLVRLYAWKLLLAKEGAISWLAQQTSTVWLLDALLSLPAIGGPSLSFSAIGTHFSRTSGRTKISTRMCLMPRRWHSCRSRWMLATCSSSVIRRSLRRLVSRNMS